MPWGKPDIFRVEPIKPSNGGWGSWEAPKPVMPQWAGDEEKKKLFGIELAKNHPSPFIAACKVFDPDTSGALWVSINWINDPVVLANRDLYLKTVVLDTTLLDKSQFASRLLKISDEPVLDGKDRIAALALYAKVMGYTDDKTLITNNNNFTHNEMKVTFVRTEKKTDKVVTLDNNPIIENDNIEPLPLKLTYVK